MRHIWIASALQLIDEIESGNGKAPYKHNAGKRTCGLVTLFTGCLPCFSWSFLWRCIACPCMCLSKGCGFACSNNGCTDGTDACIGSYWSDIFETLSMPKMPAAYEFDKEELTEFVTLLTGRLEKNTYDTTQYAICEALFKNTINNPTPYNVLEFLKKM